MKAKSPSCTSGFALVLFTNVLSSFADVLDQFPNFFGLINSLKNEVYTLLTGFLVSWLAMAERVIYMCGVTFAKGRVHETIRPLLNRIELDSWHSHLLFVFIFVFFVVGSGIWVMLNMAIDNEPGQHFVLQA